MANSGCVIIITSQLYHDPILVWTHQEPILILNSPVCHPIFDLGFSFMYHDIGNVQMLLETFSFPCCKCVCTDTGYLLSTPLVCTANVGDCWAHICFSPANSEKVLQFVFSSSFICVKCKTSCG